jgi:hypothetical protein
MKSKVSLILFYPYAHYPVRFGTRLTARETVGARCYEGSVSRWRERGDAHAVFSLDAEAIDIWKRRSGAPARWLPEPPVTTPRQLLSAEARSGCLLYGALAPRKGVDLLADALTKETSAIDVLIAGEVVEPGYEQELRRHARAMAGAGARVRLDLREQSQEEISSAVASARCVVLPYRRHRGMSRILVEAAACGTPVVAHDYGLLGYLVRRHRLGIALDCRSRGAFRTAVMSFTELPARSGPDTAALARFAGRFTETGFTAALRDAFH